jgi:type IV secretion system protein VirD4
VPGFRTYALQAVCCLLIALICLWGATEWAASALGFHPSLGAPWITLLGIPVYGPWSLFVWWLTIGDQASHVFARAGTLAALGGVFSAAIAIGGGIRRGRAGKVSSTYGSARWACERDIRKAGLYGDEGVVLGCLGNSYLRHDGPEHILASLEELRNAA